MDCEHDNLKVNTESIENTEKDRLDIPVECRDCGKSEMKERRLEWEEENPSKIKCNHEIILINYDSIEINSHGNKIILFIPGECDECGSGLYDEFDILQEDN